MIAAGLSWLTGKIAGPLAALCALLFAAAALWQTARIDGAPFVGGGLKAQVAALQQQLAARDLADAKAQNAMLAARQQAAAKAETQAGAHEAAQAKIQTQIQTVIEKVPVYVAQNAERVCPVLPWGAVRLLDAAASGADPDTVRALVAPGQPDDAASGITLSDLVSVLAANLGAARQNASQLEHLEKAVAVPGP